MRNCANVKGFKHLFHSKEKKTRNIKRKDKYESLSERKNECIEMRNYGLTTISIKLIPHVEWQKI